MDLQSLVERARGGDVEAFVALTGRFQHAAYGSALALLRDFQLAEDVVQEAFVAAWAGLPGLAEPAAFPGWLRGIVRHQAFRLMRRKQPPTLPLADAEALPSEAPAPDHVVQHRDEAAAALAAIAQLPDALREVATLFFVHECSHQDIASFLGLSVATVNNRLHAARKQLKQRMLTMMKDTLHAHALPDDFANRIGRLVETRGGIVEALFDPTAMPDILAELAVSDEANRRAVNVHVVQRAAGGLVRGVALSQFGALPRGATVLSSGKHTTTPVGDLPFEQIVPLLAGPSPLAAGQARLVETGIKVIDVMCPLVAGGSLALAGEFGAGTMVVMEELVRRLSGGPDAVFLFTLLQRWKEEDFSYAAELEKDGYSEGTVGSVQTFFFRAEDGPWTAERLAALAPVDSVVHLSRERAKAKLYPCVDVLTSRSRALDAKAVSAEHARIAESVRQLLATMWADNSFANSDSAEVTLARARKLQNFFGQPFFVAEPYTKRPGSQVSRADALEGCRSILDGECDDLAVEAFYFEGSLAEIRARWQRPEAQACEAG
ncbi:MAG TPA: sigma-70 family RNA polymerase sigma factor [Xanthobacteraceae bacterium]|nr:sigma-70 family RNA polymerase sigma factor [Xanthobacteraceae bacterium]